MYIALFYLPNLTVRQQAEILALSKVGNAVFVDNTTPLGITYSRLRNIELADLQASFNVWTFPARTDGELTATYNPRVKTVTIQAFEDLRLGLHDAIWLDESRGFQNLNRQPEFQS